MKIVRSNSGLSIIATVIVLLMLTVFGALIVSLVTTVSNIGLQEELGMQAFYIAEGGLEFAQRQMAQNLDWYLSTVDPIQIPATSLASGNFSANIYLPATELRTRIPNDTSTNPIRVYSTNRFPSVGYLQIDDDITGGAEFVQYTGISGNTFTGISRNVTVGGVTGTAGAHPRGSIVYPVTTLVDALPASCNSPASFRISIHSKFLYSGTIIIEGEEISYTASTISGPNMTLLGVKRCLDAASQAIPPGHASGVPVTPLLAGSDSADYQAEVVSNGTSTTSLSNAVRVTRKNIQR